MEKFNLIQIVIDNYGLPFMVKGVLFCAILSIIISTKTYKYFYNEKKESNPNIIDNEENF
jgi:hypothetical protein